MGALETATPFFPLAEWNEVPDRPCLQADCTPPGNILAKVVKARPTGGNYIGFAVLAVAGEGTVTSVDIKGQGDVSP